MTEQALSQRYRQYREGRTDLQIARELHGKRILLNYNAVQVAAWLDSLAQVGVRTKGGPCPGEVVRALAPEMGIPENEIPQAFKY